MLLEHLDLRILVLNRQVVAVQVLLLLLNGLLDDGDLGEDLFFLAHVLLCLRLGDCSCLLGILELRLHVVVLVSQLLDLLLVLDSVLCLLFLQLVFCWVQCLLTDLQYT